MASNQEELVQLGREMVCFLQENVLTPMALYINNGVWTLETRIEEWLKHMNNCDIRTLNGDQFYRPRE